MLGTDGSHYVDIYREEQNDSAFAAAFEDDN